MSPCDDSNSLSPHQFRFTRHGLFGARLARLML